MTLLYPLLHYPDGKMVEKKHWAVEGWVEFALENPLDVGC